MRRLVLLVWRGRARSSRALRASAAVHRLPLPRVPRGCGCRDSQFFIGRSTEPI